MSDSDDDDNFDDWVDNLYSFMHLINPVKPATTSASMLLTFMHQEFTAAAPAPFDASADRYLDIPYKVPRSKAAHLTDKRLTMAYNWLNSLRHPSSILDHMFELTLRYSGGFFVTNGMLWKHDQQGAHKWVLFHGQWTAAMETAHNDIRHRGFYVMHALLTEHYWWPFVGRDVTWFVKTCHICQLHQTHQISILPTVAMPAPLFSKIYMDTMHLLRFSGFSYIVQGQCSLTHYPEFWMLRRETAQTLSD